MSKDYEPVSVPKTGLYEMIDGKWVKITPERNRQRMIQYFGYDPTDTLWRRIKRFFK